MPNMQSLSSLPPVWCDFNACGWGDEDDDPCYYAFDWTTLSKLGVTDGLQIFAYMDDDVEGIEIVGCAATVERWNDRWRVRPDPSTWYWGRRWW